MGSPILSIQDVSVQFGGVIALDQVSISVGEGTVHGLIGPNGAGKSTLINCISRIVRQASGSVQFQGTPIDTVPVHDIAKLGIARTFQTPGLVDELSVLENVMLGVDAGGTISLFRELLCGGLTGRKESEKRRRAWSTLSSLGLTNVAESSVGTLSYGTRKAVDLARALASQPKMLLLDEPTAGLNRSEMDALAFRLRAARTGTGMTMLIITHHIEFLLGVADRVTVLDLGRVIADGDPSLVQTDERVIASYIGASL